MACVECLENCFIEDADAGFTICTNCGCCKDERIIDFDHEEKIDYQTQTTTTNITSHSRTSTINTSGFSSQPITLIRPQKLTQTQQTNLNTLLHPQHLITYKQQVVNGGVIEINKLCNNIFSLKQFVNDKANEIWLQLETSRAKYTRKATQPMYIAIIYKACSLCGCTRTMKELATASGIKLQDIKTAYSKLCKLMRSDTNVDNKSSETTSRRNVTQQKRCDSADLLPRFLQNLKLDSHIGGVRKILTQAKSVLSGKRMGSIVGASIQYYIQTNNITSISLKEVAEASQISLSALRKNLNILTKSMKE